MMVKIQRPLFSTEPRTECLIYNEDRSVLALLTEPSVFQLFGKEEYKIYHHAHMEGTILHIDDRCENQVFDW